LPAPRCEPYPTGKPRQPLRALGPRVRANDPETDQHFQRDRVQAPAGRRSPRAPARCLESEDEAGMGAEGEAGGRTGEDDRVLQNSELKREAGSAYTRSDII